MEAWTLGPLLDTNDCRERPGDSVQSDQKHVLHYTTLNTDTTLQTLYTTLAVHSISCCGILSLWCNRRLGRDCPPANTSRDRPIHEQSRSVGCIMSLHCLDAWRLAYRGPTRAKQKPYNQRSKFNTSRQHKTKFNKTRPIASQRSNFLFLFNPSSSKQQFNKHQPMTRAAKVHKKYPITSQFKKTQPITSQFNKKQPITSQSSIHRV